jgi:hypothetical protein
MANVMRAQMKGTARFVVGNTFLPVNAEYTLLLFIFPKNTALSPKRKEIPCEKRLFEVNLLQAS